MNIGTATATPANGVDVNHANASGAAAVNKECCLITVETPSNDVEVWACARDDVLAKRNVHEPRRRASRIDAMLRRAIRPSCICQYASTRSISAQSEHLL
jgi:hypothetical protein